MQTKYRISDWTVGSDIGEFAEFISSAAKQLNDPSGICADIEDITDVYAIGFLEALGVYFGRKKIAEARAAASKRAESLVTEEIVARVMTRSSDEALKAVNSVLEKMDFKGGDRVLLRVYSGPGNASGFDVWVRGSPSDENHLLRGMSEFEKEAVRKTLVDFVTDVSMLQQRHLQKYSK